MLDSPERFVMVPNSILASPLSPSAKLVYGLILSLGKKKGCRLTNREIGNRCDISPRRVTDILSELTQYTAIRAEYHPRGRVLWPAQVTATPTQDTASPSKEKECEKVRKEPSVKPPTDPRFTPLADLCKKAWLSKNQDKPTCPWDGWEGRKMGELLKANPAWTLEQLAHCLANRLDSEVNHSERPAKWIAKLPEYGGGPLNKYNKPKEKTLEQRNREHAQKLASKWADEAGPDVQQGDATGTYGSVPRGAFRLE